MVECQGDGTNQSQAIVARVPSRGARNIPRPLITGAKGANRTRDTALFMRVLYRLSYLGASFFFERTVLSMCIVNAVRSRRWRR
jgi:hypothetical protein